MKLVTLSRQQLLEQSEVLKDVLREAGIRAAIAQAEISPRQDGGIEAIFLIEDEEQKAVADVHISDKGGLISIIPVFKGSKRFVERVRALIVKVGWEEWLD